MLKSTMRNKLLKTQIVINDFKKHNLRCLIIGAAILIPDMVFASQKYEAGDCITPINTKYTWHGQYARVVAFSKIDGFQGQNYILAFPRYGSNSVIFSQGIEQDTKQVDPFYCRPK